MLRELISRDMKRLAGKVYHARGTAYFEQGLVKLIDENDSDIIACVAGTYDYEVRLWHEDDELMYECSCPVGQDGDFCKHCVATGLALLTKTKRVGKKQHSAMDDIRNYLETLEADALMGIITHACKHDKRLRERLLLTARGRGNSNSAVKAWKDALNRATVTRGYIDYHEMRSFAAGIQEIIDGLAEWVSGGRATQAIDLAEYAASKVEKLLGECDDSNGELGDLLSSIGQLHLAACRAAHPDPETLAGRLLEHELGDELDTFTDAAARYADVLGEKGLAEYRRLVELEWQNIQPLSPGFSKTDRWDGHRYRITRIMETLAKQSGNVEELVAVKSRDLSLAWHFLEIAEIYRGAKNGEMAFEWAQRGLAAFPVNTDSRLRDFLIEEYLHRGAGEKAASLAWIQFEENPGLGNYIKLNDVTTKLNNWPTWRDKALVYLRNKIARTFAERGKFRFAGAEAPDKSLLVEIFLWEKNAEAAWQEAQSGIFHEKLWIKLAGLRAKEHPQDAITVYRRQIARLVQQTNNNSYGEALELIKKIKPLMVRVSGASSVGNYLAELRGIFKAKRNFMKMLDQLR